MKLGIYKRIIAILKLLQDFSKDSTEIKVKYIEENNKVVINEYYENNSSKRLELTLKQAIGGFDIVPGKKVPQCYELLSSLSGDYLKSIVKGNNITFGKIKAPTVSGKTFNIVNIGMPFMKKRYMVEFIDINTIHKYYTSYECDAFWFLVFSDVVLSYN